jgi:hypothetical protein
LSFLDSILIIICHKVPNPGVNVLAILFGPVLASLEKIVLIGYRRRKQDDRNQAPDK